MKIKPCLIGEVVSEDSKSSLIINVVMGHLGIVVNGSASDIFVNGST